MRRLLRQQPHSAAVVWLLAGLLVVLPVGPHAVTGVLVCFGSDGHIDFEDGRSGDCSTPISAWATANDVPTETQQALRDVEGCGACVDVPLMTALSEAHATAPTVPAPPVVPAAVLEPLVVAMPAQASKALPSLVAPVPPPDLAALRTVVLLV